MEIRDKIDMTDRILETGGQLFRQYGIRMITMDEIARQMGVSKKTIYAHFEDKDDLVNTVMKRFIATIQGECSRVKQQAGDAIEETFLLLSYLHGLFTHMNPVVLSEMEKYHFAAYRDFNRHQNEFVYQTIRENLQWGIREGLYRPEIQVDIIARFRLESSMLCFRPGVFEAERFPVNQIQKELMEQYLYGIASPKGQKLILVYQKKYLDQFKFLR